MGEAHSHPSRLSRRQLLLGGAAAGAGSAAALGADAVLHPTSSPSGQAQQSTSTFGEQTISFYGEHQAGVEVSPRAFAVFVSFDLHDDVDAAALTRMMRVLTEDSARLTQGSAPLADVERELAEVPANLTVTFGFGPGMVSRVSQTAAPSWLGPLPSFAEIDQLEDQWSDGDLLLIVSCDDQITLSHAVKVLSTDMTSFGSLRWRQSGFRRAVGTQARSVTMRNLFGQVDGTVNPSPGTDDFRSVVWISGSGTWLDGGTSFVLRRISMDMSTWGQVDRTAREESVGRTLDTGAPLTGSQEHDDPDFSATDGLGFPVIGSYAHIRRARGDGSAPQIYRFAYNYERDVSGEQGDVGLLFGSFQQDVSAQFVPIQRRLAQGDLLNQWTTPVGSAVFAIPPGCAEGGFVGQSLFEG